MRIRALFSFILLIFSACTSIKSNENISLIELEGRNKLIVNYDRGRYSSVKIDNIVIDSGRVYYVKSGSYILSYVEEAFINGYISFSWKGSKGKDNEDNRKFPTRRTIEIDKDMEINLENHMIQVEFSGTISSDEKF